MFKKKREKRYFFVEANSGAASCVICGERVAVLQEYNLRRHYKTKHLSKYSKFTGRLRTEKFQSMKPSFQWQGNIFSQQFTENESVTRTSYKIVQKIIKRGKPFTDGSYNKECIMEAAKDLCPPESQFICKYQPFSQFSCAKYKRTRREHSKQLRQRVKHFCSIF